MELKERLDRGEPIVIVDVREPQEYQINRIAGSTLIPLGELPQRCPGQSAIMLGCVGRRANFRPQSRIIKWHMRVPRIGDRAQQMEPRVDCVRQHLGVGQYALG